MLPAMLVLVLIYRIALRTTTAWRFFFPWLRRRFCGEQSTSYLDPMFAKWVMARSTEVWPRGIRPHDLDGVFGHYRLSRSRLYAENLVKQ
jgi:hypothetical protein